MATIKEGYASQPLEIRVDAYSATQGGKAEVWTEMFNAALYEGTQPRPEERDSPVYRTEVLHYATIQELIELRNEINQAIKDMAGV